MALTMELESTSIVNLNEIQIAVVSGSGGPCRLLRDWLDGLPIEWWVSSTDKGLDVVRNQVITRFLREDVPKGKKFLLSINGDDVPVIDTNPIISTPGDLLWCGDVGHWGSPGHYGDNAFGCGCFRASADLLSRMRMPWFETRLNDCYQNKSWLEMQGADPGKSPPHTQRIACECDWFARRARKAGAEPKMVGIVGNQQGGDDGCILFPDLTAKPPWKVAFPCDLRKS